MKFTAAAAVLALTATLAAAEPVPRATPAPARRQNDFIPDGLGDLSPAALSSNYAAATSALSDAANAGAPSSLIAEQRSSLDAAFSSAFAALSSLGSDINTDASSIATEVSSSLDALPTELSSAFSSISDDITSAISSFSSSAVPTSTPAGAAGHGYSFDAPISLAITGAVGLFAAVLVL